ncbi:hypothetical protein LIER_13191 [Lithospermum erythrorhizon]|uniref:Gag-pol polyprotein n=1 Tax=Lithospermum erythrorhizon TaxID=34254 RepID=A0AAV3PWS3_LITER
MIFDVEKRRGIQGGNQELTENVVIQTRMSMEKVHYNQYNPMVKGGFRKKEDKSHLKCTNCEKVGHMKVGCFRIVEFLEWWENPKGNGQFNRSRSANVNNISYQGQGEAETPLDHTKKMVNFTNCEEFAGNFCANLNSNPSECVISGT